MTRTVGIRLLLIVPVLFLVSLGTFQLVTLVPGNPEVEILGSNASAEDYVRVRTELGLDKPWLERYGSWLGKVMRGDLGKNVLPPVEEVKTKLMRAFPVSLQLAGMATALALVISIPAAMMASYRPGAGFDRVVSSTAFAFISVPSFLLGILLKLAFALNWRWLPDSLWVRPSEGGWVDNLRHATLPVLTIALSEIAVFTRLLRNDMMATLQDDFILAARAKGMTPRHIMVREALRPSSFSLITLAGVSLGRLIGGTVIVESLFGLPGVGSVVVAAAGKKDFPLVQGGVLIIACAYVLINVLIDISYAILDPRIRRGRI
ncbi:MAG TPA: ABC transporter permease [Acidimicrobiales bacterium]|nr:ABC transporter permease [Acidimicrobiales bacterium]